MYRLFRRPTFLIFLFILAVLLLNIFLMPLVDNISPLHGFMTLYIFWFILIILSFLISRTLTKTSIDLEKDDSV
ncbi:MAG: hypothetical protein HRT43_10860 [Campylobacteraceae bacterium]|nr:hypothetical protein [Campylobacteraceae bacterium]